MEGINYEIMKMIDEHQRMRARQKANAQKMGEKKTLLAFRLNLPTVSTRPPSDFQKQL